MQKSKKINRMIYIIGIFATLFSFLGIPNLLVANSYVNVSGPGLVIEGQDLVFAISYDASVRFIEISDVTLNGFSASKEIYGSGNTRYVKLKNIRGSGSNNSITVNGVGYVGSVKIGAATSNTFRIKTQAEINEQNKKPPTNTNKPVTKPQPQKPVQNTPTPVATPEPKQEVAGLPKDETTPVKEEPKQEENTLPKETVDPNKEPIPNTGK